MFTPRQARQGSALLPIIVLAAMTATAMPPPVQADESVKAGEGGEDRGLDRPPAAAAAESAAPALTEVAEPAPLNADPAMRQSLNEYLVRDRAIAIELANAARAISKNRGHDALPELQSILDAPADVFVWQDASGTPVPARTGAAELFRTLPAEVLAEYERLYGGDARRLLIEFKRTYQPETQRELLRRYEFTRTGAEALRDAAIVALDRGLFLEAARLYERFFKHPLAGPPDAGDRARAELAAQLAAAPDGDVANTDANWRLPLGSAEAHRQCPGTLPTLNPAWSATHEAAAATAADDIQTVAFLPDPQGTDLLSSWLQTRHERRLPCAGANFALVDGGRVLVRDYSGIAARDLRTGELLWQFPCLSGLARRAAEVQAMAKSSATPDVPLAAAQLFNEFFAQNSVLGMLSSDGRRVYCIDLCETAAESEPGAPAAVKNRLVALALEVDGCKPGTQAWEAEAVGRVFLGPPLPSDDRLYAIAEQDSLVSLLALDPRTGSSIWEQPISLVDAAIADDPQRARQACVPSLAGGLVVCPTQLGTIVGVDARSGALEWVYAYAEVSGPSQPWRKARAYDREFGTPEFPNLPAIVGQTIIVLAPQSEYVHGIELRTGRKCWKVLREDAQYAATIGSDLVLLVGTRNCVARRITDGELVWKQAIDAPSGRGLVVGNAILLPTSEGRIQTLDTTTGKVAPDLLPRLERTHNVALRAGDGTMLDALPSPAPPAMLGNLISSGEYIVACSPTGVSVYPQAGVMLDSLREAGRAQPLSSSAWLEKGELELRLGDGAAAEQSLWQALKGSPSSRTRRAAECRLRELLYAELSAGSDPGRRLNDLDRLCVQPEERARFLLQRMQHELRGDDVAAALQTAVEISDLVEDIPAAMDARGLYIAEPQRCAAAALVRFARANPNVWRQGVGRTASPDCLTHLAESVVCSDDLRVERCDRAQLLASARQHQSAELLLLGETRQADAGVRRSAVRRLAALWQDQGLTRDAERLLDDAQGHFRDNGRPAELTVERAEIEQRMCDGGVDAPCSGRVLEPLLSNSRENWRLPSGSRALYNRGMQGTSEKYYSMSVVDVAEPRLVADLPPLPPRVWRTGDFANHDAGHFLPIVGLGDVHGVSLLEGRIIWSATPTTHRTGEKPLLGPFGPEYCILQSQETVTALDPHDGHVLWRRTDLPFDAGLEKGDPNGMIGDDLALVIFDVDHVAYRVLDPRSGELLATGSLEPAAEQRRRGWSFGRRLLFISHGNSPELKLWDPLLPGYVVTMPCAGRCLVDTGIGSGLATILNGNRLLILDTRSGETLWETAAPAAEAAAARQIRGIRERDRFVIHVEQDVTSSPSSQATHDISNVANVPLSGTIYVIDRTSRTHWSRSMPRCNLLLFPNDQVPVLITLGRTREGPTEQGPAFVLEVIDGMTGQTLAINSELERTSKVLVHSRYDAGRMVVELLGEESQIDVRLSAGGR
ncbi:MAG: PQQ-binding-like beta-propeller repeat protein [Planctomycetaceae bacterium]|nr:PQQ-binding-like beta-propeller repeat protein [Planctomycetaceae bacterium]